MRQEGLTNRRCGWRNLGLCGRGERGATILLGLLLFLPPGLAAHPSSFILHPSSFILGSSSFLLPPSSLALDAFQDHQDGLKALEDGDFTTALAKLEAAVAAEPHNNRFASDYRQAVIRAKEYDRCLDFFEKLVSRHPASANAHLNYGFAYVDKIPDAGAITQVILANNALTLFTRSLEIEKSWIGLYTRGNSYLYWPRIFNRTHLGVADLEEAFKLQKGESKKGYHVRVYISLGDGYWKMDELDKARALWREGFKAFPDNPHLRSRLSADAERVNTILQETYDVNKRVDTNLEELWKDD